MAHNVVASLNATFVLFSQLITIELVNDDSLNKQHVCKRQNTHYVLSFSNLAVCACCCTRAHCLARCDLEGGFKCIIRVHIGLHVLEAVKPASKKKQNLASPKKVRKTKEELKQEIREQKVRTLTVCMER